MTHKNGTRRLPHPGIPQIAERISTPRRLRQRESCSRSFPQKCSGNRELETGGESGIRTHGRVSPTHAFQACSFNHSDISPHLESMTYERPATNYGTRCSCCEQWTRSRVHSMSRSGSRSSLADNCVVVEDDSIHDLPDDEQCRDVQAYNLPEF